jgi:hypothetical protein
MRVCFVRASQQNVFFDELVGAFRDGLEAEGVEVSAATDHFPPLDDDIVYVFVPHEYLPLVQPDSHPTWRQLRRSVAICTEQPGTTWFDTAAHVAADCGAAVDINELGVDALRERGVRAELVRLGYVPAWDRWGGDDSAERPIDLTFMGGHADRRGVGLARLGNVLQHRRAELYVFETLRPHLSDDPHFLSGDRKWDLTRQAKTILNIHRSELGYMEWQRVLGAMANGCVVVTEHSLGYEPFTPGVHFVSAHFDDLALAVDAILADPDRLQAMRRSAYDFLREQLPMDGAVAGLMRAIDAVRSVPVATPDPGEPAARPRPMPAEMPVPAFAHNRWTDAAVARMALKHLAMEVRALRSEVRELRGGGSEDPQHEDVIETFGPTGAGQPRVSVVVTVYNYAGVIREALMSVGRAEHDAVELVVIDDHSSDESVAVIRQALGDMPWIPARLVRRARNGGLAAARNMGFELARAELVFVLDADNAIYPQALTLLEQALTDDPGAAFAYGIIEAFDEDGPGGIISYLGWDPERLRYGNFVDAMAMVRRDAVLEVGGYVHHPALYGWEDFALWCALASDGLHGVRVPQIVARYRVAKHSMVAVTNIDDTAAWATLLRDYPVLSGPIHRRELSAPAGA